MIYFVNSTDGPEEADEQFLNLQEAVDHIRDMSEGDSTAVFAVWGGENGGCLVIAYEGEIFTKV